LADGGLALSAELSGPSAIAMSPSGNLYIADLGNGSVRLLQPTTLPANGVTNAASFIAGTLAPGEFFTIFGTGLGPAQLVLFTLSAQNTVGTSLAGTQVLINGVASPMIYTSGNQLTAIVPYATHGGPATLQVQYQGQTVLSQTMIVTASAPGIFSRNASGTGEAAALNQDTSLNSTSNPAARGSVIVLYATGGGQTSPLSGDGLLAAAPLPAQQLGAQVMIGGLNATVQYAGPAPGEVTGVMQINAVIPSGVTPGSAVPVILLAGGIPSPAGITIAVK